MLFALRIKILQSSRWRVYHVKQFLGRVAFLRQPVLEMRHLIRARPASTRPSRVPSIALSALLLAAAQPPWSQALLAYVALVPWLVCIDARRPGMVALEGLLLGILQGVLLGSWLPSSIEGLGGTAFAGGVLLVVASAWWLGVPIAVFGALASVSSRPSKPWIGISGTAVAAAAIDWTRAALPGGLPWATLGLSQWPVSGVAQLAVVGGVPLVSGVVAAVNAVIATAWRHRGSEESLRVALGTIGAVAAAAAFGLPVVQWARGGGERGTEVFRLLVVQPVIDPSEHWNPGLQRTQLTYLRELTQRELESAGRGVDAVVWPETSLTAPLDLDAALRSDLDRTVASLGTDLITGVTESALSGPHRYHNSIVWLRADGRRIADFQKTHATPLAEAAPPAAVTGALEVAFGGWMRGVRMEPGRMEGPLRGRFELAPLLCWELAFPRLLAARRSEATVAILNLADDSRLGAGFVSEAQLAAAAFRAIETRLPVVRAAQGGVSAIVDPLGRVRGRIGFGREGSLLARLVAARPPGAAERVVLLGVLMGGAVIGWLAPSLIRGGTK